MSFANLGLSSETLQAVEEAGYKEPTPIQSQAIPPVLIGRDVLGIAQTGTGKTAGFTLPMIDILHQGRPRARMPRSLILEPTRELAAQVAKSFETYGKYHKLTMALLIGGVSFSDQDRLLDRGVDVLIATPGRLLDHFERGKLMLSGVGIFVIDEADRMMDMGFIPDVERINKMIPPKHQTLFFSATMPKEIKKLAERFLRDPKHIEASAPSSPAENVEQFLSRCDSRGKNRALRALLDSEDVGNAIVFCNRKRDVDALKKSLSTNGYDVAALHGDMDQGSRTEVLEKFRSGNVKLLIASDVAARGLDIPRVSHIFNYDVPMQAEDYIHRIGRTGRAGRSGRAFMLVTADDRKALQSINNLIGQDIPDLKTSSQPAEKSVVPSDSEASKKTLTEPQEKGASRPRSRLKHSRERPKSDKPNISRERTKSDGPGPRAKDKREENTVGMGDHMPDFLTRQVPIATDTKTTKPRRKSS